MNYSKLTRHYFDTAPSVGVLGPGSFRGAAGSRAQGAWVQFDLQVESGIIRAARFLAFACPHTIALSAWVAEQSVGQRAEEQLSVSTQGWSERFEVPVEKMGRVLIVEDAWAAALKAAIECRS